MNSGLYDRLAEDAFYPAHRFGIEMYRWQGKDVSSMEAQLAGWREERDLEDAVTLSERISAARG